jgi:beta-1,4-mannosyl-glycoprotein beta-1,4-N-acetylglucosaminyltransferase
MIYDCIIFNDEARMLYLHMAVLNDVVDKFVIAEGLYTFSGIKKDDYNYYKNINKFKRFSEKIIFVPYPAKPSAVRWENEFNLREQLKKGLTNAKGNDIIIISDVDEIADPRFVKTYEEQMEIHPHVFDAYTYYYYLNVGFIKEEITTSKGMIISRFRTLDSIQILRNKRFALRSTKAGWHFSFMGGIVAIQNKLSHFSHREYDTPFYKDPLRIYEKLEKKEDLFDRGNIKLGLVEMKYPQHPEYLLNHLVDYQDWIAPNE